MGYNGEEESIPSGYVPVTSHVISQRRKRKERKEERGGRRHASHLSGVESSAWGGNGVFTGRREGSSLVRRRRG